MYYVPDGEWKEGEQWNGTVYNSPMKSHPVGLQRDGKTPNYRFKNGKEEQRWHLGLDLVNRHYVKWPTVPDEAKPLSLEAMSRSDNQWRCGVGAKPMGIFFFGF